MQTHTLKHFPLFGGDADFFSLKKKRKKRAKRRVRDTGVYVYRGRRGFQNQKRPGSTLVVFPT